MPTARLQEYLDAHDVRYVTIKHSPAFTAEEVARSAHVAGRDFAKTIVVHLDGDLALVVLPASRRLVLADLREMLQAPDLRLATEDELRDRFPDCALGAMPPFGNLYGLPVYVAACLAEEPTIACNAGNHTEVIQLAYADFAELVHPTVLEFITT